MGSIWGERLRLSLFGESHGPGVGMVLDGLPAGIPVDLERVQAFLDRRAPGRDPWSTPRKETDRPEILSGLYQGRTTGTPLAALIRNADTRSADYDRLAATPRPGHADRAGAVRYGGFADPRGGGHFSGRLTAPLALAGALCIEGLRPLGIRVVGHAASIAGIADDPLFPEASGAGDSAETGRLAVDPEAWPGGRFPAISEAAGVAMAEAIGAARAAGDSVGGRVEAAVLGLPEGIGDPMFGGVESRAASLLFGIPGVKAVGFGLAEGFADVRGSAANDAFHDTPQGLRPRTNRNGGLSGGITTGLPLVVSVTFRPTASIAAPQETWNPGTGRMELLSVPGRHDPCLVPRAVPVVEAALALLAMDLLLCAGRLDLSTGSWASPGPETAPR